MRRITPLMYQARTSVVTLQRKVRTIAPIGYAMLKIHRINNFAAKNGGSTTVYLLAQCYYKNAAGILRDKKSLLKTTPKKGPKEFKWGDEVLKFDVKDIDTQAIEVNILEKKFLTDTTVASFTLDLAEIIQIKEEEFVSDIKITLEDDMGVIELEFHYDPNREELLRLQQEKEKKEQQTRSAVSPEFDFLMS